MRNMWNTESFRQGLAGLIVESVDDTEKAKEIIESVNAYGDARYQEAVEEIDIKLRQVLYDAKAVKNGQ